MTVGEFIRFLNNFPKRAKVLIWDPDCEEWMTPYRSNHFAKQNPKDLR